MIWATTTGTMYHLSRGKERWYNIMRDQKDFFLIGWSEKLWLGEYPSDSMCEIYNYAKLYDAEKLDWTSKLQPG